MVGEDVATRGSAVLIVTVIVLVFSSIFVALRMISRIAFVKRVTLDDYYILLAWAIAFGLSFSICYGTTVGLGQHQTDIPPEWNKPLKVSEYVFSVLYNPALMATKTSILLFYLKLSATERIFRWSTIATMAVTNLAGIALTFLNILQCRPISATFETPIPSEAKCENIVTLYLSSAPVNIITDLAILLLPMPILTSMRLPQKQKIILIITFGVGFFVAVIDVIRIAYLQDAATARLTALQNGSPDNSGTGQRNDTDVSWYASLSYMWSAVEVNVGIMCACVPGLKPLVSRFIPALLKDINARTFSTSRDSEKVDSMDLAQERQMISLNEIAQKVHVETTEGTGSSRSEHENNNGPMDIIDFLTTPDMTELPRQSAPKAVSSTSRKAPAPTFFDFVNIKKQKSMVHMTSRESLFPNFMVTVLFLVWGIAYGFLDSLNLQFQKAARMSGGQSIGIHSAYFAGYFIAPLTFGRLCLKYWGFKACYIVGLIIYACGVLIFWPSAVLTSFPAFLVSNFIVGLGLSCLEISANPFVALCGPQKYMEVRLNLSQGVQAIGSVVSPVLAQRVLFKSATNANSLIDVQWTYLGIALFAVLLAVAYYYVPLPEATDDELEQSQGQRLDCANHASVRGIRILWISLGLAIISQFCYVGAQEAISTSFNSYVRLYFRSPTSAQTWSAIGRSCFAVSRFMCAGLNFFIEARYLLLFFYAGALVLSAVAMHYTGTALQTAMMLLYFFEGPIFPLVFAISLRGLGKHTKNGSAFLTASISGGILFPGIMFSVARMGETTRRTQFAYCVVVSALATGALYPLWMSAHPVARKLADPLPDDEPGNENRHPSSSSSSRRRSGFMGSLKHHRRRETVANQRVEHVEDAVP